MPLAIPEIPRGIPIGTYPTYLKAQEAVDYLSDHEFPVENVTGRLTRSKVVSATAATGAMWGLFMGALVLLFSDNVSVLILLFAGLLGAGFGAGSGYMAYAATGGKRDFTSNTGVVATSYEVVCDPKVAEDAANLLGRLALRDG
jgi:hypothetical protein